VHASHRRTTGTFLPSLGAPAVKVIEHFISVVPTGVWLALAAALGLAAIGGGIALRSTRRVRRQAGEVAAVTAAALTDPLTGVLNRRGFTNVAERELDRARRYEHPLAVAFVDVRGLKAVNDSEGHLAGDALLKQVAILLRESARVHDVVGRIGGDELAVLLAEQSTDGAAAMTQRVRAQVPAHRAAVGLNTPWDVTIGTATFPDDGETVDGLLAAADRRLYEQRGIELRATGGASRPPARS
jgi:diguanylate cyclase (GGDEF)-like protein